MKVEAIVISRARRPRLITLAETLIIPDITNTELSFYRTLFYGKYTNITVWNASRFVLLRIKGQTHQAAALLETQSRSQSLRSVGNERLWEQPFQACAIDTHCAVKPGAQNSVNSFVFQNGVAPSGRDSWCWPKGARPLGTRMLETIQALALFSQRSILQI